MLQYVTNNKLQVILIHIALGYLATLPGVSKIIGYTVLIIGFFLITLSNNEKEEALLISGYVVGIEVFLRMTEGLVAYEMGKYTVMLFLLLGILNGRIKQQLSLSYFIYSLLLLLGIVFTQVPEGESIRKAVVFNLSGPITLGVAALYLYKRVISKSTLADLLYLMVLPIFSMVVYLYFRTPDISEIVFGGVSNFEASGGFGPNQVSTALGFGIFILSTLMILRVRLTGYFALDALFLTYFIYRGLLTFSRGGIITSAAAFAVFFYFILRYQRASFVNIIKYVSIGGIFVLGIWLYTSDVTGGMLDNRYTNKNARGIQKEDASAGRLGIFKDQLQSFNEAPLFGIGVGNGKFRRELKGETVAAVSHNEVSRLIEEHGSIGIVILLILFLKPFSHFRRLNRYQLAFSAAFFLFWFLTISHSAMRIAMPGFLYALCLLNIVDDETYHSIYRQ